MKKLKIFYTQGHVCVCVFVCAHMRLAYFTSQIYYSETHCTADGRVKRGRGAVGSRMDETGPYLPPCPNSKGKLLESSGVGVREYWENLAVLVPEKPSSLKYCESSKGESPHDRLKKSKSSGSLGKQHSSKHRSKEKSRDKKKKKKREEEKRRKHHK
uniref:Uncharacterized protein n=1 Tax=Davidia involucrata TaxID=16924 RepID=A0A5B6Z9B1_DAVIN